MYSSICSTSLSCMPDHCCSSPTMHYCTGNHCSNCCHRSRIPDALIATCAAVGRLCSSTSMSVASLRIDLALELQRKAPGSSCRDSCTRLISCSRSHVHCPSNSTWCCRHGRQEAASRQIFLERPGHEMATQHACDKESEVRLYFNNALAIDSAHSITQCLKEVSLERLCIGCGSMHGRAPGTHPYV